MRILVVGGLMAAVMGLAACTGNAPLKRVVGAHDSEAIAASQGATTEFNRALHRGYITLSKSEYAEYDWFDGDHFVLKAERLGNGENVAPDPVIERNIAAPLVIHANHYCKRLKTHLNNGAGERAPATAARAQIAFDCWMQEAEENIQPDDISACLADLETSLDELDAMVAPINVPNGPNTDTFLVLFDFDSADVIDRYTIERAAAAAAANPGAKVVVEGHTDRSGAVSYNNQLSRWRAEAVRKALIAKGVQPKRVAIRYDGEHKNAVRTGDGIANRDNRRVRIVIE